MGTGLAPYDKAKKDNAYQLPNIGFFMMINVMRLRVLKFMVISNQAS